MFAKHWLKTLRSMWAPRRQAERGRAARQARPWLETLEDRLTPANLALTNAILTNSQIQPLTGAPAIGELVTIEAIWNTTDLPANASYRISYTVDGVTQFSDPLTFGAGSSGTGGWGWAPFSWFASPGTHFVTVALDPDNTVAETNEGDNARTFLFTPVTATDFPHKLITPIGGTPFQTWGILNYVDVNTLGNGNLNDYTGNHYTYDGHNGWDILLPNFGAMDAGVPEYAAAAGTVVDVQDGNFDRNTAATNPPSNFVEIDIGNGWHILYHHLRTNSITVHQGDTVVAGQILGLVGSSGNSTAAHEHFGLYHNGDLVEPNYDPDTYWANPLPFQGDVSSVLDSGVTRTNATTVPDINAEERPVSANVFTQAAGQQLTVWFLVMARNNDLVTVKFYQPDGTLYNGLGTTFTSGESRGGYYAPNFNLPAGMFLGTWHVGIEFNGVELARDAFQVIAAGAGAARVSQGTTYVPNGRTTPIDFGTVNPFDTPPQQTFTIANLGNATLSLSNFTLPSTFTLVGSFPTSVAAGGSASFTVRMPSGFSGVKAGILSFNTTDPNAPVYSFDIKGVVTGSPTGAVHGWVFSDRNRDGVAEDADAGQFGWTVSLLNPVNNAVLATTTTGFNGLYAFQNLSGGIYRVRLTAPAGWTQTTTANPADVTVGSADVLVSPIGADMVTPSHFAVNPGTAATTGSAFNFTVVALDQNNAAVTNYSGVVHFTSTDANATLPADATLVNGTGTFSATLRTPGNQTVTATDTASGVAGTSGAVAVTPAPVHHFTVNAAATAAAGTAFNFTVRAFDANNNPVTGYTGVVHFTSTDANATLPANATLVNGLATFSATLRTTGARTLTATDTGNATVTGTSGTVTVGAAAATHFSISNPASSTAGGALVVTVTAQDAFNNTATGYLGTVHFTKTDPGSSSAVPADYAFVAGDNGAHTFLGGVVFVTAGSQAFTATDTVTGSITGGATVAVSAAPANRFTLSAPGSAVAGNPFLVTVTVKDIFNNTATGYAGTIHFTSTDASATLPANATLTSGTGTFIATLRTAGPRTLTATDTVTSSITGTSGTATVVAAAATHFGLSAPATATAGALFGVTVTALDAFNNTASGYTGTVHFTKTDTGSGAAVLANYAFVAADAGAHTFPTGFTLVTAGSQALTATDTASNSITGTTNPIAVNSAAATTLAVSAAPAVTAGAAFGVTVTARDQFGNTATGYRGTVHFTKSDAVTGAAVPANYPFVAADNGTHTFGGGVTLVTAGSQSVTATDTATGSITGTAVVSVSVLGLVVTALTPTPTGFTAAFSKPFANSSASPINLYDAASASYGAADVVLQRTGDANPVKGSLLIDPTNQSFTFVKTGGPVGGGTTGLLTPGTYTVTLGSGATAFKDATGAALDGNGDGVNGDTYTTTFTVTAPAGVVVTVPDFARGPDAADVINVPNNSSNGIPIALSNGSGVTDAAFVLNYDATLLTITGGTVNGALAGATLTVTTSGSGSAAQATITFHSPTALASGAVRLGGLVATVPTSAPYKAKDLLHFSSLSVNGGAIAAVGDDGVHLVGFLGDASGDGTYTSADSVLISRVASAADSGFAAFPAADPAILADLSGNGLVQSSDGALLNNFLGGTTVAQVPTYPGAPSNLPSGPDPTVSIPTDLRVAPGGVVTVPVNIDDPRPAGSTGMTQTLLAITYDPTVFSVTAADIRLGSVPAAGTGWSLQARVDAATGQIGIVLFSATPISASVGGSLVTIDFHVQPGAPAGPTSVNLAGTVNPDGRGVIATAVDDNQGALTLHPAPTNADDDPGVDGMVWITGSEQGR
jgi:murein DD-endopeptidase MepM/ murein hydrolase activator NlpD